MSQRVFEFRSEERPWDVIVDGVKVSGRHPVQLQLRLSHYEAWKVTRELLHQLERDSDESDVVVFGDMSELDLDNDEEPMPIAGRAELDRLRAHVREALTTEDARDYTLETIELARELGLEDDNA